MFHRILPRQNAEIFCDVLSLWHCKCYGHLCGPTVHVASRQAWLSPRSALYTYICHVLYLIYISWASDCSERRLCFFVFLAWCLIPTNFTKSMSAATTLIVLHILSMVSIWLVSIRQFVSSWNKCNGILKMPYFLIKYTHTTHKYTHIFSGSDHKVIW